MNNMIKTMSLLLALLLTLACFAACGNDSTDTTKGPDVQDTTAAPGEDTGDEDVIVRPDIPKENNNGEEFMVLYPNWSLYINYLFADDISDNMTEALYKRTLTVEEWLGVNITTFVSQAYNTVFADLQTTVAASEDVYDLMITHSTQHIANTLAEKYVLDWNTIEHVDLTSDLWNQSSVELFERDGVVPLAVNDLLIPDVNMILFNPAILAEYGLESPYDLVLNNQWTLDKMFELASKVYKDEDGDNQKSEGDIFGLIMAPDWKLASVQHACGQMIIEKDEEGTPQYVLHSERMVDIVETVNTFFQSTNAYGTTDSPKMKELFAADKGLFYMEGLAETLTLRALKNDFGILPIPKWDASQEHYISTNWCGYMGVPTTVMNTELVGKVVTLLAYENNQQVMPEFFDILLGQKLASDIQSQETLKILFEYNVFDLGITLNQRKMFQQLIVANSSDVASKWANESNSYQAELDKFLTAYDRYLAG